MARKIVFAVIGVVFGCTVLTGCLFNTGDQVIRRFVGRLKGMRWGEMAELVDWPQSSQYVRGLPRTNSGEDNAKREAMMAIAENLTGVPVREKTPAQIRDAFMFLKLARLKHIRDGDDWAWLELKVTTDKYGKTVQVLVMKINRVWRIVLTDSIFK